MLLLILLGCWFCLGLLGWCIAVWPYLLYDRDIEPSFGFYLFVLLVGIIGGGISLIVVLLTRMNEI